MQDIQSFNIEINKPFNSIIQAVQGDVKSRFIEFCFTKDAQPLDLTSNSVRVYAKKTDGTIIFNDLTITSATSGIALLELTTQMLNIPGLFVAQLLVIGTDNSLLSTNLIYFEVKSTIVDGTALESTNEYQAFINALSSLVELQAHLLATSNVHGTTGAVVGTNGAQYLVSKTFDRLKLDTSLALVPGVGEFAWDAANGTASNGLDGNVILQLGQEELILAKNEGTSTILNGQVVYWSGVSGSTPTFAPANATNPALHKYGVATEDIAKNARGYITTIGIVRDINTSAWPEGTPLYLSTVDGQLSSSIPAKPNQKVFIGVVLRQHASLGSIFVSPDRFQKLGELADVDTTGIANKDALVWESATSKWVKNTLVPEITHLTSNGGYAIRMINKTASPSVKGTVVTVSSNTDNAFMIAPGSSTKPIGVVFESGIADGSLCLIVVAGICEVLLKNNTSAVRGNWVTVSDTDGRADATVSSPNPATVFASIGYALESKTSGTDVLLKTTLHLN